MMTLARQDQAITVFLLKIISFAQLRFPGKIMYRNRLGSVGRYEREGHIMGMKMDERSLGSCSTRSGLTSPGFYGFVFGFLLEIIKISRRPGVIQVG